MKRIGTILLGILLALGGLAAAGFGLIGAFGDGEEAERFLAGTTAIPFGIMLLELGLAAVWLSFRARRGGERPALLPPWWASALAFVLAVGGGYLALRFDQWWAFFPLATVAVFAPIAAAGRLGLPASGVRPPWAPLLAAFAWGALVTPALAIMAQVVVAAGMIAAVYFGFSLGGQDNIALLTDTWRYHLQGRTLDEDQIAALVQFLLREPSILVAGAAVLVFAAPATEELVKALAIPLFGRTRPQPGGEAIDPPLTIFLIGLASGLGFAATENVLYVAQAGEQAWWGMALFRAVTPLMHGTATALFALGWARQARRPRGWALLWGALAALGLHAAWNLCAGLVIVAGFFATGSGTSPALAGLLLLLSLGVLGGLLLLSIGTLLRQRRVLTIPAAPALAYAAAGPDAPPPPPTPPFDAPEAVRGEPVSASAGRDV
jgi:RsiW-degrading membrane proteinase PrsW (M82 family)